ncbi:MAG: murein biosynthesis integral membrane protein MurJ [Actinomycetota bacterium]
MDEQPQRRSRVREVVRHTSSTSVAAALGVASGLLLDVVIAASFGAGQATDAFFVAARIPFGIAAILLVGANQALVPAISTWLERRGRRETWRLTTTTLLATSAIGVAVALLATILAGPLIALTAPGLDPGSSAEAVRLSRILFWLVPLVAVAEVFRAVLNALHSFVAPALMHVVLNGVAAAIVIAGVTDGDSEGIVVVAWAYVAGAALQAVFLLVAALWRGYRPVRGPLRDPEVAAVGRLCVRPLAGAALNPVARIVEQIFISYLPSGSITILNYGYRLISAIGGSVLFRSVIVVLLPRLTRATSRKEHAEVRALTRLGVQVMLGLSIPLTALMAVLAGPAVLAIFQREKFDAADASLLGKVLAVYALSLVGSAVQRAFLAPFFAALNTKVPLRNTIYGVLANLLLIPPLLFVFGDRQEAVVGVALAYSLAQYVNVLHGGIRMKRDLKIGLPGIGATLVRLLIAGTVMAAVMIGGRIVLGPSPTSTAFVQLAIVTVIALVGIAVFLGVAMLLGLGDLEQRFVLLRRKAAREEAVTEADAGPEPAPPMGP